MNKCFRKRPYGRCPNGHRYCSDCKTKRGRNLGNRTWRHNIKIALQQVRHG